MCNPNLISRCVIHYNTKVFIKNEVAHQSEFCVKSQRKTSETWLYHCWHYVHWRAEG